MKAKLVRRMAAVLLAVLMTVCAALPAFAVTPKAAGSFQNVTTEYIALNALRREPFVS
ncbi:MAG: hypothetical protein J6T14_02465 [Clostridia bacterium]|nr:hypothetical protein [Clostridia bacterium]